MTKGGSKKSDRRTSNNCLLGTSSSVSLRILFTESPYRNVDKEVDDVKDVISAFSELPYHSIQLQIAKR